MGGRSGAAIQISWVSVHPDGQRIAFTASGPRKQSVRVLENLLPTAGAAR